MTLTFYKYQGTGNDFIMIDDRDLSFDIHNTELVKHLCDRRFGIGADGLILLQAHPESDFFMKYYNSDGNESSMCGNGGRCLVAFAHMLGVIDHSTTFMAVDGLHQANIHDDHVELKMNDVNTIERRDEDVFILNTGSPHYVRFEQHNIHHLDIVKTAKTIRYNDEFKEKGINVNFVNQLSDHAISIRTYERGVEDETFSCGTGVTASAITLALKNSYPSGSHTIDVNVMGGQLKVSYLFDNQKETFTDVWLKGPAKFVFRGSVTF